MSKELFKGRQVSNFVLNFGDVQEQSFAALPPGTYRCMLERLNLKLSSAGNLGLNIGFVVQEGAYSGRYLFTNRWVSDSEKNQGFFKHAVSALGVDTDQWQFGVNSDGEIVGLILGQELATGGYEVIGFEQTDGTKVAVSAAEYDVKVKLSRDDPDTNDVVDWVLAKESPVDLNNKKAKLR